MADAQKVLAKYQRGIQNGSQNYRDGVDGAGAKWQTAASSDASEARYQAGIQAALAAKRRQKALQNTSAASWQEAAMTAGATNYAASATKAAGNYAKQLDNILAAGDASSVAAAQVEGSGIEASAAKARAAMVATHRHWARVRGEQPQV